MNLKGALTGLALLGGLATAGFIIGGVYTVDNGEYVIEKAVSGTTTVQGTPSWYVNYGSEQTYKFLATIDFTTDVVEGATKDRDPIDVNYNDAMGNVQGTLAVEFPTLKDHRKALHAKYGSQKNAVNLLVDKALQEAFNMTAVLMKSQEAFMTHRAIFRQYALDQLENGLYQTYVEEVSETDDKGVVTKNNVTKIRYILDDKGVSTGVPARSAKSPLAKYGIKVSDLSITRMGFDPKTLRQIDVRRDSENAVIISKANADKAAQEAKEQAQIALKNQAIESGKANVIKARAVINANREKELAIIKAQMKVAQAEELANQRDNEYTAAQKEALTIEVISVAKAAAADREIKAGGNLSSEQKTRIEINKAWATAHAKKAVSQYVVGNADATGVNLNATQEAMQALSLKAARDLIEKPVVKAAK